MARCSSTAWPSSISTSVTCERPCAAWCRRHEHAPSDLDLLRRHEPILRFTDGELFFPMAAGSYVEACELLTGPNLREARVSIPAGELDLERLAAVGDPLPGEAQFLRFVAEADVGLRAAALAEPARAPALLRPGSSRAGRPPGTARRCGTGHVVAGARPRPGWHGGRRFGALRRDLGPRPTGRLPRPGRARGPLGRPPLHVLLRDERLALHVRRRQRSRGRPRAVLRRPRGARRRHDGARLVLRGRPRREGR